MMPPFWLIWLIICALAFVCLWAGWRMRGAAEADVHLSPWQRHRDRNMADLMLVAGAMLALFAFLSSAFVAIPFTGPLWRWV
jgi:hypothetical protein